MLASVSLLIILAVVNIFYNHSVSQSQVQNKQLSQMPYGPDGKDIRHAMQTVDSMHISVTNRLKQVTLECNKHHTSDQERGRLLDETLKAGKAAINEVVASKYTIPFDPHYPPLPH